VPPPSHPSQHPPPPPPPARRYYVNSASSSGSQDITLWANGKASACDTIAVEYVGSNKVTFSTGPITVAPLIQQVHLSVTNDPTTMVVDFVSSAGGSSASCDYGLTPDAMTMTANGTMSSFSTIGGIGYARLTSLAPNTTYYYACTDGVLASATYSFVAAPAPTARPLTVAVFADFGVDDGFGLSQIAADAQNNAFDLILHAGDFAYDLESGQSANGGFFMNRATMYSTNYPVLPAPGNHEAGANFTEYKIRHSGVAAYSNTKSAMYYSVNWMGIHFLAFNSETYVDGGIEAMTNWIRQDLAAVDRTATPWVVAFAHKLWWMVRCLCCCCSPMMWGPRPGTGGPVTSPHLTSLFPLPPPPSPSLQDSTDFSTLSGELQAGGVDVL
jgi:hypothetical protein